MAESALATIRALLEERYGEDGRSAADRLHRWLTGALPSAYPDVLERHLDAQRVDLLFDAFRQDLPFGTGGRRGRVGYGANRLNPTTVVMTVQGHCDYIHRKFPGRRDLVVVVANDVREFHDLAEVYRFLGDAHPLLGLSSRSLAKLACEVYAGNGITAYLAEPEKEDALLSTPELSFLIGELGGVGGVNLSASHNPPDDNGIKVYDEYGSQPVPPDDQLLIDTMQRATRITAMPFTQAVAGGLVRAVPPDRHEEYIQTYVRLYGGLATPRADVPIVYTPLCGCGLATVGHVLERLGFALLTPPDEGPDGTFAAIPFKAPNPEVPQATQPAQAFADSMGSGIVLSSDPDADRVGLEVRQADGRWYHFDGDKIGAILCYFLMLDPRGPRRRGLVVETLVTTRILARIVERAGDSWLIDDLLVGFKYVAEALKTLERHGRRGNVTCAPDQLVLAVEESHGVMMVPTIRDKDATPACMYLAALYQRLREEGRTLVDYYVQILEEFGEYDGMSRSIVMRGAEGARSRDRIMASLRASTPRTLAGRPVRKFVDYWDEGAFGRFASESDRFPRNVVQLHTDGAIVTVRPSGTEPKLKLYCQLLPDGEPARARGRDLLCGARDKAVRCVREACQELLARIGVEVREVGLRLPDLVDLEQVLRFEADTVPELRRRLAAGSFAGLDGLLAWLRGETAAMTPGADPLPALKAPLSYLCDEWGGSLPPTGLLADVRRWASA